MPCGTVCLTHWGRRFRFQSPRQSTNQTVVWWPKRLGYVWMTSIGLTECVYTTNRRAATVYTYESRLGLAWIRVFWWPRTGWLAMNVRIRYWISYVIVTSPGSSTTGRQNELNNIVLVVSFPSPSRCWVSEVHLWHVVSWRDKPRAVHSSNEIVSRNGWRLDTSMLETLVVVRKKLLLPSANCCHLVLVFWERDGWNWIASCFPAMARHCEIVKATRFRNGQEANLKLLIMYFANSSTQPQP